MPDDILNGIDRFWDALDRGVDSADRVLNRAKHTDEKLAATAPKHSRRAAIDVEAVERKPKAPKAQPQATAITRKVHFYISETIDPKSGATLFIVTDGGNARAECTTHELATQILRALEKQP